MCPPEGLTRLTLRHAGRGDRPAPPSAKQKTKPKNTVKVGGQAPRDG